MLPTLCCLLMLYVRHFYSLQSRADTSATTSRHCIKGYLCVSVDCTVNSSAMEVSWTAATCHHPTATNINMSEGTIFWKLSTNLCIIITIILITISKNQELWPTESFIPEFGRSDCGNLGTLNLFPKYHTKILYSVHPSTKLCFQIGVHWNITTLHVRILRPSSGVSKL